MSEKLSIAYVVDGTYAPGEGVYRYVETLANHFQGEGHEVNVIAADTAPERRQLPNVHTLGGRNRQVGANGNTSGVPFHAALTRGEQFQDLLDEIDPDVLHVQMPYTPFFAARFIERVKPETAVVGTFHSLPNSRADSMLITASGLLVGRSLDRVDEVIAVSPAAQYFARDHYGVDSTVIHNPVNLGWFSGAQAEKSEDGKLNVSFMGRLVERKGAQHLIKALPLVMPGIKGRLDVKIAGKGPMRGELEAMVARLGLDQTISFENFVEDEASFLASADIAIFPATGGESFGIVLLEALASGAGCVVAGNNKGYVYGLCGREGDTAGLTFDPNDHLGLAMLIEELASDPEKRAELRKSGLKRLADCDIDKIGPKIMTSYRADLDRRQGTGSMTSVGFLPSSS